MVVLKVENGKPSEISRLTGLGSVRQIEIQNGYAYITSREDGLYIVDISDVYNPKLCTRYATIEFATGVAVNKNICAVGCRNYGTELIDVTDPYNPKHISNTVGGEVQSVFITDHYMYTGCWEEHKVMIYDIADPSSPKFLSSVPTAGRGDGVFVSDNKLYCVSAGHGPNFDKTANSSDDPDFGTGNALEIYDVSDTSKPTKLSRTDLVEKYYYTNTDWWDVQVSYPYAYVNHTYNGAFIYDISDPENPVLKERFSPKLESNNNYWERVIANLDKSNRLYYFPFNPYVDRPDAVSGMAIVDGQLYLAGLTTDLYGCNTVYAKKTVCPEDSTVTVDKSVKSNQVYSINGNGSCLYLACGNEGIKILDSTSQSVISTVRTNGSPIDLQIYGDYLFSAEGRSGLSVYKINGNNLEYAGHFDGYVRYLSISKNGRFAVCVSSSTTAIVLDISDIQNIKQVLSKTVSFGLLYGKQLTQSGEDYIGCFWQANIIHWFDVSGDTAKICEASQTGAPSFTGGIAYCGNGKAIILSNAGHAYFDISVTQNLSSVSRKKEQTDLLGMTYYHNGKLVVASKIKGKVWLGTIDENNNFTISETINVEGNPVDVFFCNDESVAIATIHGGMIVKSFN